MFKRFLMSGGAQIHRAPEDDHGSDFDATDVDDFNFEDPDAGDDEDDQDDGHDDTDDGDDADSDVPPARQQRQPSRQTQRVQTALKEAKEARERAERLEQEMSELRSGRQQQSQADRDAAERDLLATMTAEERLEYRQNKMERTLQESHRALAMQTADVADKASFNALCARDKTLASIQDRVEEAVVQARKQGSTADRDTIANYILGKLLREKGAKVGNKQRRQAANNRERENGRPGAARSDTRGSNGKLSDRAARAKRLDGQSI